MWQNSWTRVGQVAIWRRQTAVYCCRRISAQCLFQCKFELESLRDTGDLVRVCLRATVSSLHSTLLPVSGTYIGQVVGIVFDHLEPNFSPEAPHAVYACV